MNYAERKAAVRMLQKLGHDLQPSDRYAEWRQHTYDKTVFYENEYLCLNCRYLFGVDWEGKVWRFSKKTYRTATGTLMPIPQPLSAITCKDSVVEDVIK